MYLVNLRNFSIKDKSVIKIKTYITHILDGLKQIADISVTDSYKTDRNGGEPYEKYEFLILHQIDVILDKFEVAPFSEMSTVFDYHLNIINDLFIKFDADEVQKDRFGKRFCTSLYRFENEVRAVIEYIKEINGF